MALPDHDDWVLGIDIEMQTLPQVNINIAAMTLGTVAISINVADIIGNIPIDIVAQTLATIAVDITAQTLGTVAIDITAQTLGTVNIDVTSQTVDLNIKTAGGVNIVIDQLTQAAYTERRSTLHNDGVVVDYEGFTGVNRRGKYFPRGARGFINRVSIYCQDTAAAGGTITVYLAPYVGAGYLYTADVVVPPGGGPAWRDAVFNVMWNYDSMFIFVVVSVVAIQYGRDVTAPHDAWYSTDSGASWLQAGRRFYFRAYMYAETVGDIPVSGTLNVIEIPASTTYSELSAQPLPMGVETTFYTVDGMGYCDFVEFGVLAAGFSEFTQLRIYADGVEALRFEFNGMNTAGFTASTPGASLLTWLADGLCVMVVTKKVEFTRRYEVRAFNNFGAQTVNYLISVNMRR